MQNTPGEYKYTVSEEGNVKFSYLVKGVVGIAIGLQGAFLNQVPIKYEDFIKMANDIIREHEKGLGDD